MPDISKCNNHKCTLSNFCYRYLCEPSKYQLYGDFSQDENGECEYYWHDPCKCEKVDGRWITPCGELMCSKCNKQL